jgi:tRNA G10  N-methylase Trm11
LQFLDGIAESLRSGSYICMAAPKALRVKDLANEAGFKQIEPHIIHIHDSLTKAVSVFRRK